MVRYYGRARQRVGSVNTNQPGLKQAGCPTTVGKQGKIVRFLGRRVNCNMKTCGLPMSGLRCQYGVADAIGRNKTYDEIERSNNPAIKNYCRQVINHYKGQFCQWPQPRTRQNAGGVGHIWTPRRNHCEKTCSLGWDETYMAKHDSGIPTFPPPAPQPEAPLSSPPLVSATLFIFNPAGVAVGEASAQTYAYNLVDVSGGTGKAIQNNSSPMMSPTEWSMTTNITTMVGPTLDSNNPWKIYLLSGAPHRPQQPACKGSAWAAIGAWQNDGSGAALSQDWFGAGAGQPGAGFRMKQAVVSLSIPWNYAPPPAPVTAETAICGPSTHTAPVAWIFVAGGIVCCPAVLAGAGAAGTHGCLTNSVEALDTSSNKWGGWQTCAVVSCGQCDDSTCATCPYCMQTSQVPCCGMGLLPDRRGDGAGPYVIPSMPKLLDTDVLCPWAHSAPDNYKNCGRRDFAFIGVDNLSFFRSTDPVVTESDPSFNPPSAHFLTCPILVAAGGTNVTDTETVITAASMTASLTFCPLFDPSGHPTGPPGGCAVAETECLSPWKWVAAAGATNQLSGPRASCVGASFYYTKDSYYMDNYYILIIGGITATTSPPVRQRRLRFLNQCAERVRSDC